ncbi:hypothetical protein, partial [Pseudomonas sp. FW300-N1A1]|uniref:hypothetical protein n=1 Tax=Pseudomonas sp. FW300-N1A1 TaxID=2075555 RepID=UPI001C442A13
TADVVMADDLGHRKNSCRKMELKPEETLMVAGELARAGSRSGPKNVRTVIFCECYALEREQARSPQD